MVDHIADGESASSVRTKLNALVDIGNTSVTQAALDAAFEHIIVSEADGGSVTLTDAADATMLVVKSDGSLISENISVDLSDTDTGFYIQGALERMGIWIDDDGVHIGPLCISGDGGGFALTVHGDRDLLSCDEHGARVLGAVTVAPDGTVAYRGMQTAPATGALMYAGELALVSAYAGRMAMELPLYPGALFGSRAAQDQGIVSIASWGTAPARPWAMRATGGSIPLRYGYASGQTRVAVRAISDLLGSDSTQYDTHYADLTVHNVALPKSGSPVIMVQGDSIGERGTPYRIGQHLTEWGLTPAFTGTYPTRINPTSTSDVSGPMSESRGGSRLDEHWGIVNTSPVADGAWATYLALSRDAKKLYAPLARAATGEDASQYVSGGMTLDITRYLAGAGVATPTIWTLYLGINDYTQIGGIGARATLLDLLPKTIACIRRDLGTIPIVLWTTMEARSLGGDVAWADHVIMIQTIIEIFNDLKGSDSNLYLMPIHALQDEHLGWTLDTGTMDAATGITTTTISDRIHPGDHNLEMHCIALSAMIAHLA